MDRLVEERWFVPTKRQICCGRTRCDKTLYLSDMLVRLVRLLYVFEKMNRAGGALARQSGLKDEEWALLAFPDRFYGCPQEPSPLRKVDVNRFLIPEHVQHTLKHGGGEVHFNDPSIVRICFKEHTGIVETNPGQRFARCITKLNLGTVCLISFRASIK